MYNAKDPLTYLYHDMLDAAIDFSGWANDSDDETQTPEPTIEQKAALCKAIKQLRIGLYQISLKMNLIDSLDKQGLPIKDHLIQDPLIELYKDILGCSSASLGIAYDKDSYMTPLRGECQTTEAPTIEQQTALRKSITRLHAKWA